MCNCFSNKISTFSIVSIEIDIFALALGVIGCFLGRDLVRVSVGYYLLNIY